MLYHNENDSDGIQQVLTALYQYVSYYGDGDDRVYSSQGLVADQLSVERGVNALFELSNGFTPEERLEGLHLEIADWHSGNKFLKVWKYLVFLSSHILWVIYIICSFGNGFILIRVYSVNNTNAR